MKKIIVTLGDCNWMENIQNIVAVKYKRYTLKSQTWITDTERVQRYIHYDIVCWQFPQSAILQYWCSDEQEMDLMAGSQQQFIENLFIITT